MEDVEYSREDLVFMWAAENKLRASWMARAQAAEAEVARLRDDPLGGFNIIGRDSEIGRRAMSDPEAPWKSSAGMASSVTPPDDWAVVEEALEVTLHCRADHADSRDALAALARLRARVEELERENGSLTVQAHQAENVAEAAEARVKELEEAARRFLVVTGGPPERMEDIGVARRALVDALAHEEEA